VRALVAFLFVAATGSCFTPRIELDSNESRVVESVDTFFDQFEGAFKPGPPPDCNNAMFARTFSRCENNKPEAVFPFIWDAMKPTLTPEGAAAFIGNKMSTLDRCCEDNSAVVEIDLIVGCDGAITHSHVETRGPWLMRWQKLCIEREVSDWQLDRPSEHEQGLHFLVTCGKRSP
jgi:hypothetical protein